MLDQLTVLLNLTDTGQPHGVKALENILVIAMFRCPSMLHGEALYLFKTDNNALLVRRVAHGLLCFDLNSEFGKQGIIFRGEFFRDCCVNGRNSVSMARKGPFMSKTQPFKRHRFPAVVILRAVRMYLRYPLSYQDVTDLLAERGLDVDRSTVFRWVQKFGPELSKRSERHLSRASLNWHVDETYIRVAGKWRYLWRAIDSNGQLKHLAFMLIHTLPYRRSSSIHQG